jgi:hypothetical protein
MGAIRSLEDMPVRTVPRHLVKQADRFSPTARAEKDYRIDRMPRVGRLAGTGISKRSHQAHQYCEGGCGVPEHKKAGTSHEDHETGCGTHSEKHCGGRYWSNKYSLSLVNKSDATHRIAIGYKRAKAWREKGNRVI